VNLTMKYELVILTVLLIAGSALAQEAEGTLIRNQEMELLGDRNRLAQFSGTDAAKSVDSIAGDMAKGADYMDAGQSIPKKQQAKMDADVKSFCQQPMAVLLYPGASETFHEVASTCPFYNRK
jgi:hypothetical protein